jgi:hypothetical protein
MVKNIDIKIKQYNKKEIEKEVGKLEGRECKM